MIIKSEFEKGKQSMFIIWFNETVCKTQKEQWKNNKTIKQKEKKKTDKRLKNERESEVARCTYKVSSDCTD
jgi:hypothetical protein